MLYLARSLSRLHFSSLMAVYAESNRENGREFWPEEPEMRQIQLAEEDFYRYLSQVFFRSPGRFTPSGRKTGGMSAPCVWNRTGTGFYWKRWRLPRSSGERGLPPR